MPAPTNAIHRVELSSGLREFDLKMNQAGFIGAAVLPTHPVAKQSGQLGVVPLEALLQRRETARTPRSGYNRGDFSFNLLEFKCQEHGAEEPLDDFENGAYADILDAESVAADRAEHAVMLAYEQAVADLVFDATTWAGAALTTALQTAWSEAEAATPIADVRAAALKVWEGSGLWPNALILSKQTFDRLAECAEILDRVIYSASKAPAVVTAQTLAAVFGLEKVLVASGTTSTANEGQPAAPAAIWRRDYAMLARVATSRDPAEPCIGRTFMWTEDGVPASLGGDTLAVVIEEYREENRRGSVFRARTNYHAKLNLTAAAHLLTGVLAG